MEVITIQPNNKIEIPETLLKSIGIKIGENVRIEVRNRELVIKPTKTIVDEITGAIKIDQKIAEKIIESEEISILD